MEKIKKNGLDSTPEFTYNQNDVDRIVANAVSQAIKQYEGQRSHLDNCIRGNEISMPLSEGDNDMYHRQKLTINGVSQWRSFGSMQELVDMVAAAVRADCEQKSSTVLFGDYMLDWYHKYKERILSPDTREGYVSIMKKHILPAIGKTPVSDITVADVQLIMDGLKSASYAKQTKSIINLVMDAAISDELYFYPNPTKDRRIVMPTTRKARQPVVGDDLSTILEFLPRMPIEYSRILVMLIKTGCRRGEALGARWEDIDWESKTIHLQRVVRFRHNRPEVSEKMKSRAANRTVSLWDDFIPFLGQPMDTGYIIHSNGEPLTETQYRHRWNAIIRLLKGVGLEERFTAHQLRHTYATIAANSGNVPPKVLQGMLGHANFQTTMYIYAWLDNDRVRESSQGLSTEYAKLSKESCTEIAANKSSKNAAPSGI